jgi:hypothetical protein
MKFRVTNLLVAAALTILFTACNEGNIYYTLENEVLVEDLSLPNDVTLFDVAKIGSSYFAAAGKLWTVDHDAAEWNVDATIDPPSAGGICTALVASPFGGVHTDTLFGGFINGSGNLGLYESSATPTPASATWTVVADAYVATAQIALLKVEDSSLVAVTATQPAAGADFEFGIVSSSDGTTFTPFLFSGRPTGDEKKQITDVIYSSTLTCWLATEGTELYTDADVAGTLNLETPAVIPDGEVLTGLFDDGARVYLASRSGAVYHTIDGITWTRIEAPAISGTYPPLTRFAMLTGTTDGILLVGSDGYGYYTLPTSPIGALTRFPTTTSDLYMAAVQKLYFDTIKNRVFACTAMGGLWRGAVAIPDGSITWNLE